MNRTQKLLTPSNLLFLHQSFDTSEIERGTLRWKVRPPSHFVEECRQKQFNNRYAGCVVGSKPSMAEPYVYIGITHPTLGSFLVRAHRLIWLLYHGEAPPKMIDHINRITFDNRPCNLRASNSEANTRNSIQHSECGASGSVSVTPQGRFKVDFSSLGSSPWNLEFDSEITANTALNYLSFLHDEGCPLNV